MVIDPPGLVARTQQICKNAFSQPARFPFLVVLTGQFPWKTLPLR